MRAPSFAVHGSFPHQAKAKEILYADEKLLDPALEIKTFLLIFKLYDKRPEGAPAATPGKSAAENKDDNAISFPRRRKKRLASAKVAFTKTLKE
ncbi:MAG: hypothetical protein K2X27_24760 [Candidatus Obscuribacterales bacterium]|nr:hypothetical protein [Candidatus Obscuribacterales bacterium]